MKRIAIYMRVSTDKQAQEGDSIPAQRDALLKYINTHDDMILAGEYLDDGISGTRSDRDELCRMLDDVQAGKVDLILVTKLDRLYRSIRHYLNMMEQLDKAGVGWLAIWEPIYDTTTPQGRLIVNQMMSIAQFEAEQTGQRVRQVLA
jgi:DNA invertase Pin-like site-specific DNA recombinase